MWWRQKLKTHVVLLFTTISLTVGLVLVRNSVSTWAHPIVWVAIVATMALICFSEDAKYEYVCPKTGSASLINGPSEWNEVFSGCPKGSVIVGELGLQHP
jgi:hypothetical protein